MRDELENAPVYGRRAVTEFLKSGQAVDTVLLADGMDAKTSGYFLALAKAAGAVVKQTKSEKLDAITGGGRHQGVAAYGASVEYKSLDDILALAESRGEPPFVLLADGVADPHNLGALMRTALLCGAHGVVIEKRGSAGVTPVVMKASAGAAALLPVARVANLGEAVRRLKERNVFVFAADMAGETLARTDLSGAVALVVGSEGHGVAPLVKKLCDGVVRLPLKTAGSVDSLNVSVAGGILMYHIFSLRSGS